MFCGFVAPLEIVGSDQICLRMTKISTDQRDRKTRLNQALKLFVAEARSASRYDDAIGTMVCERVEGFNIFLGAVFADADKKGVAALLQYLADATTQFRGKRICDSSQDETDGVRSLTL